MEVWRGDIFYVSENTGAVGSEFKKDRPAVVVSNNRCNKSSPVVEIVYLTSYRPGRKLLPTHVIVQAEKLSVAKCEAIYSVDKKRLDRFVKQLEYFEMERVGKALRISLGL